MTLDDLEMKTDNRTKEHKGCINKGNVYCERCIEIGQIKAYRECLKIIKREDKFVKENWLDWNEEIVELGKEIRKELKKNE